MQDVDLFMELAAIAGVFVGFGALIAVRSGGANDAIEVMMLRWVLANGMWVIVAALAPVTIAHYRIGGHELWLASSLVAIAGFLGMFIVWRRHPETREAFAGTSLVEGLMGMAASMLLLVPMFAALILILLGATPDLEVALYLTALVLGLLLTAWTLIDLVFMPRRRQTA